MDQIQQKQQQLLQQRCKHSLISFCCDIFCFALLLLNVKMHRVDPVGNYVWMYTADTNDTVFVIMRYSISDIEERRILYMHEKIQHTNFYGKIRELVALSNEINPVASWKSSIVLSINYIYVKLVTLIFIINTIFCLFAKTKKKCRERETKNPLASGTYL